MNQKVKEGSVVTVHYKGTENGQIFDSTEGRAPFVFTVGNGEVIPGFESSVLGREINEKYSVFIPKDLAYGEYSDANIQEINRDKESFPDGTPIGSRIQGTAPDGRTFYCFLKDMNEEKVFLDLNHPLAGKDLNFDIQIVSVENGE